jgi:hypothetical protein
MGNAAWESRPEMEARLRDTQLTMFDWVNIRRAEEYLKMVDGALPPIPSETETGSRTHAVKARSVIRTLLVDPIAKTLFFFFPQRKPVPSLDNFHDEGALEAHPHQDKSGERSIERGQIST